MRFADRMSYRIKVKDDIEEDLIGVPAMIVQPYLENAIEHGLRSKKTVFYPFISYPLMNSVFYVLLKIMV